jgi:hypothetical protein
MRSFFLSLVLLAAGCGDSGPSGGGDDLSVGGDGGGGGHDLAKGGDLAKAGGDLAMGGGGDLAMGGGDLAMGGGDLAMGGGDMAGPLSFTTVFTILLENHDYSSIVGNMNDAPYINSLIAQGGLATMYNDSGTHPSLPNYLYLISGDTQYPGLIDLNPTDICGIACQFPVDKDNLGNQLQVAGLKWRSYQESAGGNCVLNNNGNYAPKHDPFLYFKNIQLGANGLCAQTNVQYGDNAMTFENDLAGGTYKYMFITPNLLNDGHDPANDPAKALKQSDDFLKNNLMPKILGSNAYKNGGVVFLTWDEGQTGDHVPMIILSPKAKVGYQSAKAYNHASYLATVEDIFKVPRLGAAGKASTMFEFFQ